MHNTILLTFVMVLTALPASAQFYTISKDYEITGVKKATVVKVAEAKENNTITEVLASVDSGIEANAENPAENMLNTRKGDDWKSSLNAGKAHSGILTQETVKKPGLTMRGTEDLPELTIPNLLAEIKKNNIKYPKIVLAQAILETGWFKSSVCRNKHNLFGLTNPRTGKYYEFNNWTESVKAYYTLVQHRYKGGNYLLWLDKIGYAEDKTYVRALIKVLKQL